MQRASAKSLRKIRLLVTILVAQVAAMSLMLGAAALVIDNYSGDDVAQLERGASQEAPARQCSRKPDILDLLLF